MISDCRSKRMPLTDQITDCPLHVSTFSELPSTISTRWLEIPWSCYILDLQLYLSPRVTGVTFWFNFVLKLNNIQLCTENLIKWKKNVFFACPSFCLFAFVWKQLFTSLILIFSLLQTVCLFLSSTKLSYIGVTFVLIGYHVVLMEYHGVIIFWSWFCPL